MASDVVLVCGPPCAGKTTWVRRQRLGVDAVIDLDDIERYCSSRDEARMVRAEMERHAREFEGRVWVIRTLADPDARSAVAVNLGASRVHVLMPDRETLVERAASRPVGTLDVIDRWFSDYAPAEVDVPLP